VVASGQFLIDSEASLKGVLARMNNAGESTTAGGAASGMAKHRGAGVVRDVDGGEVFIQHGAIDSAGMGAMTMGFKAPPGGVPANVKEGARVDFEFSITPQGEFALWSIAPVAGGPPAKDAKGGKP
jgi:Cu(I)/Ag(I) efflux system membrane fusion protein